MIKKHIYQSVEKARRITRGEYQEAAMLLAVPTAKATAAVVVVQAAAQYAGFDPEGSATAAMMIAAMVPIALAARRPIEDFAGRIDARLESEDATRLQVATDGIEVVEIVAEAKAEDRLAVATAGVEVRDATDAELVAAAEAATARGDFATADRIADVLDLEAWRRTAAAERGAQEVADGRG